MKYVKKIGVKPGQKILGGIQGLGGLTAPTWTNRPHMGPFNKVSTFKISKHDEPYRQHDIGYGKLQNPYLNFNKYDSALIGDVANSSKLADVFGKTVFKAKQALDLYNVPSLYKGGYAIPKKDVNGRPAKKSKYKDRVHQTDLKFPVFREGINLSRRRGEAGAGAGFSPQRSPRDFRPKSQSQSGGSSGKNIYSKVKITKF